MSKVLAVKVTKEVKRQALIQELKDLGVFEFKEKSVNDLDYFEAKHALSVARAIRNGELLEGVK